MDLRIVFMGTPSFAVPSLSILLENGFNVVGVITSTDKYGGRGKKTLLESDVKKFAKAKGLPILQPKNLKDPIFLEALALWKANLQIVVAFRMLPEVVWNMPELGTFNLHGSLLPKYRGAAPLNWAIINGDKETGVSTFFLQHEIDTGDLLLQESLPIGENETAGELHDRMMDLGAKTVLKTVQKIKGQAITGQKQNDALASKAPKIFHNTCQVDFHQSTQKVHDFIRGMSPYPAAWTLLDGKTLKLLRSTKEVEAPKTPPGSFETDNKSFIKISTLDGYVQIHELQLQGRKRMATGEFLNGFNF